jgi:hypothetical protein
MSRNGEGNGWSGVDLMGEEERSRWRFNSASTWCGRVTDGDERLSGTWSGSSGSVLREDDDGQLGRDGPEACCERGSWAELGAGKKGFIGLELTKV